MTQAAILSSLGSSGVSTGFKNRIINGAMAIDQRNAGASVNPASLSYTLDRWRAVMSTVSSKFTVQQNAGSVTPPPGFTNYLGVVSSSAYSVTSNDQYAIQQYVEGYNVADLAWGTASAKSITLSFWVYSSLTGTFGAVIQNPNSSRSYPFLYTISSANTWTYITQTIPGDTGGATDTTNGRGIAIVFALGTGSTYAGAAGSWASTSYSGVIGQVSVVGTSGATLYITGVQLEVGTTATNFEYRDYGNELRMCQRYYNRLFGNDKNLPVGLLNQGTYSTAVVLPTAMRATPSLDQVAASYWRFNGSTAGETLTNTWTLSGSSNNLTVYLNASAVPGGSNGYAVISRAYDTNNYLGFSAEL